MNHPIFLMFSVLMTLFGALAAGPQTVFAVCDYQPDCYGCFCFDDTGAWDPGGGFIQDVAKQTLGTRESCACPGVPACDWDPDPTDPDRSFSNGGKPYYQMVLGCVEPFDAFSIAVMMDWGGTSFNRRTAWCSETVSFWHKHTYIPYTGGYCCDWHPNWQIYSAHDLMQWYAHEGLFDDGRGRWIHSHQVDYENFQLGVTVPVPGAYVAIRGYQTGNPDQWLDWGETGHSLIIDEMWVHRDRFGNVFKIKVSLLEGNSGDIVRNDHEWDDILDLTSQGPAFLGSRKIFGFGIDRDASGQPVYDPGRLHYINYSYAKASRVYPVPDATDPQWNEAQFQAVSAYAELVRKGGGPLVTPSSPKLTFDALPDEQNPWNFPNVPEEYTVDIDLLDEYPLPVTGMELIWDGGFLPLGYKIKHAGNDNQYEEEPVPDFSGLQFPQIPKNYHVPVAFLKNQEKVRHVRLIFPSGTFKKPAALKAINFQSAGPYEDAEISPDLTVRYPAMPWLPLLLLLD